jgi:hypothetical protein
MDSSKVQFMVPPLDIGNYGQPADRQADLCAHQSALARIVVEADDDIGGSPRGHHLIMAAGQRVGCACAVSAISPMMGFVPS